MLIPFLFNISRRWRGIILRSSWFVLLTPLILAFIVGAMLMPMVEPETSALQDFNNYWWWFYVTITTIGYGDISPVTVWGRLITVVISAISFTTFVGIIQKLYEAAVLRLTMRIKGMKNLKIKNHVVIMGNRSLETERIIRELKADRNGFQNATIVLCSAITEENPFIDQGIEFVKGELDSQRVIDFACVSEARSVIIHGSDDNQTILTAMAVYEVNKTAHIVAQVDNPENKHRILRICPRIECIVPVTHLLIAQAVKTPGASNLVSGLLSDEIDDALLRLEIPAGFKDMPYFQLRAIMLDKYDALAISVGTPIEDGMDMDNHPARDTVVSAGMFIYYMADNAIVKLVI